MAARTTGSARRTVAARRPGRLLRGVLAAVVVVASAACSAGSSAAPAVPAVRFDPVALPDGAVPEVLVAAGPDLLVGVRHSGPAPGPGLLRVGADGSVTEVPVEPATGYGRTASWYSLAVDGGRVLGVGGDRGGAHGNVRWSMWSGTEAGVREQAQAFSTFGGWGAGDLVDAVFTPAGPVVVGSWQSADAGLDVAVWTASGDTWSRADSTGTPLQSTRGALGFATDATGLAAGIVVVGWQLTRDGTGPVPVVWRSGSGDEGWTRTPLPADGAHGAATAARCADGACAVAGRLDGKLALWRLDGEGWTRVAGTPAVPVADADPLPAPLAATGPLIQLASDGGTVRIVRTDGAAAAVRPVEGPSGPAVAAVDAGGSTYLIAGAPDARRLWRAPTSAVAV